ncbi:hypothetical protein OG693_39925 [Streptomyces sp. NBC_01259]|uniref:hypothetical protein n=1 Tax=Streptomyces sp. NBC_01259 TaxID=2903800 RepID=UPI00324C816B
MSASQNSRPAPTHPVILLARTVAVILGILTASAHLPALWVILAALTGYAVTLASLRRNWPAISGASSPAAKTG